MLIVHLFVSYAHVNLCHFFSSSWCQGWLRLLLVTLPGLSVYLFTSDYRAMSDAHGWKDLHKTVPADPWCQYFKFNAQLTIRSLGTSSYLYSHPEGHTTDH